MTKTQLRKMEEARAFLFPLDQRLRLLQVGEFIDLPIESRGQELAEFNQRIIRKGTVLRIRRTR